MTPAQPAEEITFTLNGQPFTARIEDGTVADGGAARAGGPDLAQERLRAPGFVRLLHRARRRPGAVVMRRACPAGRRQARRHPGGLRCPGAAHLRPRLRGDGRPPVRLLHPRHRGRGQAPDRRDIRDPTRGADCRGAEQPRLPLHGLRQDRRCHRDGGPGASRRAAARGRLQRPRSARSLPRQDAERFVLGDRPFVDDMRVDGMLRGAFLFSAHPRARVLRIDTAEAASQPGVVRVVTAADVPGERYQGLIYQDWPLFVAEGETTHCIGDILAAVAADTEAARPPGARAHPGGVRDAARRVLARSGAGARRAARASRIATTCCPARSIARGDVDAALAASAFVETRTFTTQLIEHAFLEPEACLAVPGTRGWGWGLVEARRTPQSPAPAPDPRSVLPGPGRLRRPPADRLVPRHRRSRRAGDARLERRRVRRQGGPEHPGPDCADGAAHRAARQGHADARGEHPPASQTPPDDAAPTRWGATGTAISPPFARASSATRARSRRSGPRCSNGRPGTLPARTGCPPSTSSRWPSTRTTCPAAPCGGSGPTRRPSPSRACSTSWRSAPGSTRWEIRWRNAVDAGDTFCTGQVLEHAVGLKQTLLAVKDAFYAFAPGGHRLRRQERRHRQRHAGGRPGHRRGHAVTAGW